MQTIQSHTQPVDRQSFPSPLTDLRRADRLLRRLHLQFHGPLAGIQAGWDAPVEKDLHVTRVIPQLLEQLLQEDGHAWIWVGTQSVAQDDPVDMFRLVELVENRPKPEAWGNQSYFERVN